MVKFSAQSEHFLVFGVKGLKGLSGEI
jgi:hypothetical protein